MSILACFLTGCNKELTLNLNNVSSIVYDEIKIQNSDFEDIIDKINNEPFYDLYNLDVKGKNLIINSNEYVYNFEILDNFIIYKKDNAKHYTKSKNINEFIKKTISKYIDTNFFNIELKVNYNINDSDYLIKMDDSNHFIILNTKLNIYDFKISNKDYASNLENKIDKIDSFKTICIETNRYDDILISFLNPYDYKITITYKNGFDININN